jgi:hypothetical protein
VVLVADTNGPVKLIDTTMTDTHFCEYYINNATEADGVTTRQSLSLTAGYDASTTATNFYECLKCPFGKQAMISFKTGGALKRFD